MDECTTSLRYATIFVQFVNGLNFTILCNENLFFWDNSAFITYHDFFFSRIFF